eukprot:gene7865-686_t
MKRLNFVGNCDQYPLYSAFTLHLCNFFHLFDCSFLISKSATTFHSPHQQSQLNAQLLLLLQRLTFLCCMRLRFLARENTDRLLLGKYMSRTEVEHSCAHLFRRPYPPIAASICWNEVVHVLIRLHVGRRKTHLQSPGFYLIPSRLSLPATVVMGTLEHPKTIKMYRNGDLYFPARPVVVNTHVTRNWDAFLDRVTQCVRPNRAAIRIIYNAETGKRVRSFQDLEEGRSYVAAGIERFKHIPYETILDARTREKTLMQKHKTDLSTIHHRVIRSGRAQKLGAGTHGKTIYVTMNGDLYFHPVKVLVNNRTTPDLFHLYDEIGKKVAAYTAETVTKVYDISGHRIRGLNEVTDGGQYVAVTRGRFLPLPYFAPGQMSSSSPARIPIKLRTNLRFLKSKKPTSLSNGPSPKKYPLNGYSTAPSTYTSPSKVAVNHSSPNKPSPTNKSKQVTKLRRDQKVQSYNVTIITGNDQSHATDANVFITLHGTKGDTQRQQLREDSDNFDAGSEDVFALQSESIGDVVAITLEQDDSGASSAWFVERVTVRDTVTNKRTVFNIHDWLATDRGNMI